MVIKKKVSYVGIPQYQVDQIIANYNKTKVSQIKPEYMAISNIRTSSATLLTTAIYIVPKDKYFFLLATGLQTSCKTAGGSEYAGKLYTDDFGTIQILNFGYTVGHYGTTQQFSVPLIFSPGTIFYIYNNDQTSITSDVRGNLIGYLVDINEYQASIQ